MCTDLVVPASGHAADAATAADGRSGQTTATATLKSVGFPFAYRLVFSHVLFIANFFLLF